MTTPQKKPAPRARAAKPAAETTPAKPAPRTRAAKTPAPKATAPKATAEKAPARPAAKAAPRSRTPKAPTPPAAPDGLTIKGRALWRGVLDTFDLRADELTVLEEACRAWGRVHDLTKELAGMDVMIPGSTGQLVVNPLLAELRAHEAHVATLLARLKLKDVDAVAGATSAGSSRSTSAREKANARWTVPHAHGASA